MAREMSALYATSAPSRDKRHGSMYGNREYDLASALVKSSKLTDTFTDGLGELQSEQR